MSQYMRLHTRSDAALAEHSTQNFWTNSSDKDFTQRLRALRYRTTKAWVLHEALGFCHLGTYQEVGLKFGRWHDVGWWRRALNKGLPVRDPLPPFR